MDVRKLYEDLVELHGEPERSNSDDGVKQLLTTILSQNVADTNTARASESLFSTYRDYHSIRTAPVEELADTIRVAGFPETKAERIQRTLERIYEETDGEYTLAFIEDMETDAARDWLTGIKGVGPKTAGVVLNFHFERPAIAVDTHVERVSKRFGLVPNSASNQKSHDVLNEKVPDDLKYALHVLLISHGREYCSARDPDCQNSVCETYCECSGC